MKFSIEDLDGKTRSYEWLPKMTIEDAMFLKEKAYLTIPMLGPAVTQVDPHAIAALVYFAKRRNGEPAKWEDILKLDLLTFGLVEEEEAEEPGKSGEASPTKSAGKSVGRTRKPDTSNT